MTKKELEAAKLMEEAKKIEEARKRRKQQNDDRRFKKQSDADKLAQKQKDAREKGILEAYEKINKKKQDKRDEDERLAKELKEIKLQRNPKMDNYRTDLEYLHEVKLLKKVNRFTETVTIIDVFMEDPEFLYIVTEYCEHGDLEYAITRFNGELIPEDFITLK